MLRKPGLFHRNQRGFTLVELIVAIAITAVIGSVISGAIFQIFNVSAANSNHMKAVKQVENALYYINRDAESSWQSLIPTTNTSATNIPAPFVTTTLSAFCSQGQTTISVNSPTVFPQPKQGQPVQLVIGAGTDTELVSCTKIQGNIFYLQAGTQFSHAANDLNEPVSTLAFHWENTVYENDTYDENDTYKLVYYDVIYYLNAFDDLQRTEITSETGATTSQARQTMTVASDINPDLAHTFFTFDGTVFTVNLQSSIQGYKPAEESRTLYVKPRIDK